MFPVLLVFLTEPFTIIGAFFWNPIENGFIYIYILKLICIAIVFYKLILGLTQNRYSAFLTSIIISFNGFLMLWGQHYYFVNKILYFIILIYSLEVFLRIDKKFLLLFCMQSPLLIFLSRTTSLDACSLQTILCMFTVVLS